MSKLKKDTPQNTVTQIGTPTSKLKVEDSLLSNYFNTLTPIKTSISITQTFGSLSFASPPSGFKSYGYYSDPFKVGSGSTGEALLGTKPPQILKNDCTTIRVINDGFREDGETDLQKMCDRNVKQKSDTPDCETMFPNSQILIYASPYDKDAYRCFLLSSTDSKTRSYGRTKPRLEPVSNSVTKRRLDFEMQENCKQTLGESSSEYVAPRIGLHLNAIAMSSKDNNVGSEYSFSGQRSNAPVLPSHDFVRENVGQIVEEVPKSLALVDMNQRSPKKKKRRKSEPAGEGESSCKRCNCKKSKCLKLYCECFAAGVYCIEPCSCIDCFNKPIYEDTVLDTRKQIESRNPLAFAPKVIRNAHSIMQAGDDARKTPASARHKRGCNCRKSNCLKKYCECYQSGVGCSINCRCEGCKNTFGRKFASLFIKQDDENETYGNSVTAKPKQKAELLNSVPLPPSTPMPIRQPLAQLPISSINMMLPQHGASGSSSYNSQSFSKQDMSLLSHSRIETITEDIENLIQSPIANINAVSPNNKKVSPPHLNSTELTPCRRNGGRKLLQSIPSFPSLTPHH